MINSDVKSNAQPWELEIVCKNRKYLEKVVGAILSFGFMEFELTTEEVGCNSNDYYDGIYTVLVWSVWFHNLADLSYKLKEIEQQEDKI